MLERIYISMWWHRDFKKVNRASKQQKRTSTHPSSYIMHKSSAQSSDFNGSGGRPRSNSLLRNPMSDLFSMEFPGSLNRWDRYHIIPQLAGTIPLIVLAYWVIIYHPSHLLREQIETAALMFCFFSRCTWSSTFKTSSEESKAWESVTERIQTKIRMEWCVIGGYE